MKGCLVTSRGWGGRSPRAFPELQFVFEEMVVVGVSRRIRGRWSAGPVGSSFNMVPVAPAPSQTRPWVARGCGSSELLSPPLLPEQGCMKGFQNILE